MQIDRDQIDEIYEWVLSNGGKIHFEGLPLNVVKQFEPVLHIIAEKAYCFDYLTYESDGVEVEVKVETGRLEPDEIEGEDLRQKALEKISARNRSNRQYERETARRLTELDRLLRVATERPLKENEVQRFRELCPNTKN